MSMLISCITTPELWFFFFFLFMGFSLLYVAETMGYWIEDIINQCKRLYDRCLSWSDYIFLWLTLVSLSYTLCYENVLDVICWNVWDLTVIAAASWLKYIRYIRHPNITSAKNEKHYLARVWHWKRAEQPEKEAARTRSALNQPITPDPQKRYAEHHVIPVSLTNVYYSWNSFH